jgi:hypothetical protein
VRWEERAADKSASRAKQLANPIAFLVSVPFQFNWEQNVGPSELTRFILNVQPVMPFTVTENLSLIVRLIAPLVSQPPLFDGGAATFGMGDVTTSFFLSPSKSTRLIWGAGPVIVLPSTSEPTLGTGKWSAGPTIVALKQTGPWTIGALWNQVWSFSGDTTRSDVNQMFLQPFLSYQATHTIPLTLQSETTANWEVEQDRWTVPINVVVSKLSSFGTFPPAISWIRRPSSTPGCWTIRESARGDRHSAPACQALVPHGGAARDFGCGSPSCLNANREPFENGTGRGPMEVR